MKDKREKNSKPGSWQRMRALVYPIAFRVLDRVFLWCFSGEKEHSVAAGPFQGMFYGHEHVGSVLSPKLLGTYEMELHQIIRQWPSFDVAIDIGAAEGWYACGLLYIGKTKKMVAFESTEEGRAALQKNAERNQLESRLEIHGECTKEIFLRIIREIQKHKHSFLIISDCEGFEKTLFDSETISEIKNASLLIETHDVFRPNVHETLRNLLQNTHHLVEIQPTPRKNCRPAASGSFSFRQIVLRIFYKFLISERRPEGTGWILGSPRGIQG